MNGPIVVEIHEERPTAKHFAAEDISETKPEVKDCLSANDYIDKGKRLRSSAGDTRNVLQVPSRHGSTVSIESELSYISNLSE